MHVLEVCEDDRLKLAINLSFACSLRFGELLGLTWDCIDISPKADPELLAKVLGNPDMVALLTTLAKGMK